MHFSKWVRNYCCMYWDVRLVYFNNREQRHLSLVFVAAVSNKLARANIILNSLNCSLLICLLLLYVCSCQSLDGVVFPVWSQISDCAVHFQASVMNFYQPLVMLKEEFDCCKTLKQILKLVPICCLYIGSFRHW